MDEDTHISPRGSPAEATTPQNVFILLFSRYLQATLGLLENKMILMERSILTQAPKDLMTLLWRSLSYWKNRVWFLLSRPT